MTHVEQSHTPAEFVAAMRRLKQLSGLGFRSLEKIADAAGEALPRSTLTAALSRDTLPREHLVAAFVRACGGDDGEVTRWLAARRRIAGETAEPGRGAPKGPPDLAEFRLIDLVPPAIVRGSRPLQLLSALLSVAVLVVIVAAFADFVRDWT